MDHSYALEIAESLRFHEEIRSLMRDELDAAGGGGGGSPLRPAEAPGGGSSFTALLELAPHQAAELLGGGASAALPAAGVKSEPAELDEENAGEAAAGRARAAACRRPAGKRKEPEKKVKSGGVKKSKSSEEEGDGDGEKLPYVHVRARRGQATDSHSLAERARREKINARMKLLQELVPGCSKISGTALVLDEIINHVQSLQRQVEFLSMKLAAVNPRIDFSGLDNFLAAENPRLTACNGAAAVGMDVPLWAEVPMDGGVRRHPLLHRHQQQQIWQADMVSPQLHPPSFFERSDDHHHQAGFLSGGPSPFAFDSSNSSVALSANQLKMETDI